MLDTHSRNAAILHIVLGFLSLLLLACLAVFFRALAEIIGNDPGVVYSITTIGPIILGTLVSLCLLQIGSAITYLKGWSTSRTPLIIFSIIALFNVPVGTAAGGYSLWALLRK